MSKVDTTDFRVAPRSQRTNGVTQNEEVLVADTIPNEDSTKSPPNLLFDPERNVAAKQKALEKEDARKRLRNLKRANEREIKHFVNVALDSDLKQRLSKASFDHDISMTVIIRDALSSYLTENGY